MRSFLFTMGICVLLVIALAGNAPAAGVYTAGKGECKCSPLVAAGVIPDALNELAQIPSLLRLGTLVDRVAGEIKSILTQFGVRTAQAAPETETKEVAPPPEEKKPEVKKPAKKEKPKAKRVKRPPTKI